VHVKFSLPHRTVFDGEVSTVTIPAQSGDLGVCARHVPTIAQLRPGIIDLDDKKMFVAGGYAFVHPDSTTDICAIEAAELDDIDGDLVAKQLAEAEAQLTVVAGKDEMEEAIARIKVDALYAIQSSLK